MTANRGEEGSTIAGAAVAFVPALIALAALAWAIKDGQARTEVQELAFQAADVAVAARNARAAEVAAEELLRSEQHAEAVCVHAHVRVRDPAAFRPGGRVNIDVQCDVPFAAGRTVTYTASAERRIDPYRQVDQP